MPSTITTRRTLMRAVGAFSLLLLAILAMTGLQAVVARAAAHNVQTAMPPSETGALLDMTGTPTATPTQCGPIWLQSHAVNDPLGDTYLHAISVLADNNAWAVGYSFSSTSGQWGAIIEHWNGSNWTLSGPSIVGGTWTGFYGVAAISANDVWAVGSQVNGSYTPLLMHWNGSAWTRIDVSGTGSSVLFAISALSANDIWAAGRMNGTQTLTLHFDGNGWSIIPSPSRANCESTLYGISAYAANDVWAVGEQNCYDGSTDSALVEHWDGQSWTSIPSPVVAGRYGRFMSVAVASPADVWAVGSTRNSTGDTAALVEHWDGLAWNIVPAPTLESSSRSELWSVTAVSPSEVWAVGNYSPMQNNTSRMDILHWDGATLSAVPGVTPPAESDGLNAVTHVESSGELWAVGGGGNAGVPLVIKKGDDPCATATNTPVATFTATLTSTATATATATTPPSATYISTSTATPSATSTRTTSATTTGIPTIRATATTQATATATPTMPSSTSTTAPPPTGTPTTTPTAQPPTAVPQTSTPAPTACNLQFADVVAGNAFYAYARCLACRGVMSGYACGGPGEPCEGAGNPYFRPVSPITRGQIAKIVANAAGLTAAAGAQLFQDVPPDAPFYVWVNRLAMRGMMGGYPCGGPEEPCEGGNLPYFYPNASATRGQLAKIVSNAAGYSEAHTEQTFQDAPPTSTFYVWIQRLASRGAMSGYPCGGFGEPCDTAATPLPYFRTGSNVTRGQASKIVGNTFFPECTSAALGET